MIDMKQSMFFEKKWLISIVFVAICVLFAACDKEERVEESNPSPDTVAPAPEPQPRLSGYLVSVIDSASMTLDEFASQVTASPLITYADQVVEGASQWIKPGLQGLITARRPVMDALFLGSVGLDERGHRQWAIESYVFTYRTITPTGEAVTLSGRVTFPNNTVDGKAHLLDSYTLFSHQYVMATDWVPSECYSLMSMRALWNSAVIEPDEQGYGIDLHQHSVNFIAFPSRARQLADCALAAVQIMQRHNVQLASTGFSTNWGSSLGAPIALSFARYYDREATDLERSVLRLKSTYLGEGPLDYAAMLLYKDQHPEAAVSLTSAFYGLGALSQEQLHGYAAEEYMPAWMGTAQVPYDGTGYSYFYAASHVMEGYNRYKQKIQPDTLLVNILSADMLDQEGHLERYVTKTTEFLSLLREQNTWDDWQPQTDIYMAHAEADDQIPVSTVRPIYERLRTTGASARQKLHWLTVNTEDDPLIDNIGGPHYGASIEAMLYMVLAREPKDMNMFYSEE